MKEEKKFKKRDFECIGITHDVHVRLEATALNIFDVIRTGNLVIETVLKDLLKVYKDLNVNFDIIAIISFIGKISVILLLIEIAV